MREKLKIAIVGCGAVAYRWYFRGLQQSEYCEIAALVDIDSNRLKKAAEYCSVNRCYSSIMELCEAREDIDIVVLLTPHKVHYSQIKYLLENDLNVYSEKPCCETYAEALELLELAKEKKKFFCSAPQVMLSSRNKMVKEYIDKGIIGDIVMVRASGSNMGPAYRADTDYDPEWFYNDGGSMSSLGIYTLAIVIFLFGMPKRVAGFSGISMPSRIVKYGPAKGKKFSVNAPDNEVALLDYGNNYILFDGSYVVWPPQKDELVIHGTAGTLYVGGFGGLESIRLINEKGSKYIGPEDDCHVNWNLSWGIDEMAKAIICGTKPLTDATFAAKTIKVLEAIRRSSKSDKTIELE